MYLKVCMFQYRKNISIGPLNIRSYPIQFNLSHQTCPDCVHIWISYLIMQVVRDGRHVEVSIRDIVVGDVIPLNIGDQVCGNVAVSIHKSIFFISAKYINYVTLIVYPQVPACGILITAQSLSIDTSRVNGDSNIVSLHASSGASRLKPGWKIADGSGTMLVKFIYITYVSVYCFCSFSSPI